MLGAFLNTNNFTKLKYEPLNAYCLKVKIYHNINIYYHNYTIFSTILIESDLSLSRFKDRFLARINGKVGVIIFIIII